VKQGNSNKRLLAVLIAAVLLLGVTSACGGRADNKAASPPQASPSVAATQTAAPETAATRTVKDMAGNDVVLPQKLEKVAITHWGEVFDIFTSLGEVDRIAAMADTTRYPWIRRMLPQVADIPDYGSFEEVNVEEMIKLDPDVIFVPASSTKVNQKMRDLGLPVYVTKVEDTHEYYLKELRAISELLGKSAEAEALIQDQDRLIRLVQERVQDIPREQRKKVYIMRKDILQKHNKDWQSSDSVEGAGGINIAGDTDKGFETNIESLLEWKPEVILQVIRMDNNDEYYKELAADGRYRDIPAIASGETYVFPVGINYWYGSSETGLGRLLIGKILYPERFADIDLKKEAQAFYRQTIGLDMTDADYEMLLKNFNGARRMDDK